MTEALKHLRIIYMGTPEFAVAPLQYLVAQGLNIVGVITAPDKPAGRGMQLQHSAVKTYALTQHLNILQPNKLKAPDFIDTLKKLQADIQIVVAFRMLPEIVWAMPPMGTLNLHASLLPQYRGAAPINWAIIHGETITGLTTFLLQHNIDTGDILLQQNIPINQSDNVGSLYKKMMDNGGALILKTLTGLVNKTIIPTPQPLHEALKHAPKIFKQTCEINFNTPAQEVHNFIRGLSPYPAAFTKIIANKVIKIFETNYDNSTLNNILNYFETDNKTYLKIKCSVGCINVLNLQMEGKKRMDIKSFLHGYSFIKEEV